MTCSENICSFSPIDSTVCFMWDSLWKNTWVTQLIIAGQMHQSTQSQTSTTFLWPHVLQDIQHFTEKLLTVSPHWGKMSGNKVKVAHTSPLPFCPYFSRTKWNFCQCSEIWCVSSDDLITGWMLPSSCEVSLSMLSLLAVTLEQRQLSKEFIRARLKTKVFVAVLKWKVTRVC